MWSALEFSFRGPTYWWESGIRCRCCWAYSIGCDTHNRDMNRRLGRAGRTNVFPEIVTIVKIEFFSRANVPCYIDSDPSEISDWTCVRLVSSVKTHVDTTCRRWWTCPQSDGLVLHLGTNWCWFLCGSDVIGLRFLFGQWIHHCT